MAEGLFILRAFIGFVLFAHGTQKLFGWFGGYGLAGTGGFFEQIGHRPGRQMAALAGLSEAGGGVLLILGFLTPVGAAALIGVMAVATVSVHADKGFWNTNGGYELPVTNAVAAAALAFTGAGSFSVDHAIGWQLSGWDWGIGAVFVGLLGAGLQLAHRQRNLTRAAEANETYPVETATPVTMTEDVNLR